jgi:AcrR family transcriptional regulator
MPRGFDEHERELLRTRLLDRGEELLGRLGVARTTVEEVTRGAGISKGAFYSFFESKELLAWEVLRRIEVREREELSRILARPGAPVRAALAAAIGHALSSAARNPAVLRVMRDAREMDLITRRLPAAAVGDHFDSDRRFLEELRPRWEAEGLELAVDPAVAAGMLRALFVVASQGEQVAGATYPRVQRTLVAAVIDALLREPARRRRAR